VPGKNALNEERVLIAILITFAIALMAGQGKTAKPVSMIAQTTRATAAVHAPTSISAMPANVIVVGLVLTAKPV